MRIYIAGPMRWIKNLNFPAFHEAARTLRLGGHDVFNPAERDELVHGDDVGRSELGNIRDAEKCGFCLRDALAADTSWICRKADAIVLLPGWEMSKDACAEKALGEALGLQIIFYRAGGYAQAA